MFGENNEAFSVGRGNGEILFEGDIVTSIETIVEYYDIDETTVNELRSMYGGNQNIKRAAASNEIYRWSNRRVPYEFSSNINADGRENILEAIRKWEQLTCLFFFERTSEIDYIFFQWSSDVCYSCIGRQGGGQVINLNTWCLQSHGTILHEIGHALGLWHEQSRPDRDKYVIINWDNIESDKTHNFEMRDEKRIDFQDTGYDFDSIMHYNSRSFADCYGCTTIDVRPKHGNPVIGQLDHLSSSDILQVNRMYNCPGPGHDGVLVFYIRNSYNLSDFSYSDPYLSVRAIDKYGYVYSGTTDHKSDTQNPMWNEMLIFRDHSWQFFRLSVWDENQPFSDGSMSMQRTFPLYLQPRRGIKERYCTDVKCNRYVWYDYWLLNPTARAQLEVYVRYAHIEDSQSDADPWVLVQVIDNEGTYHSSERTRTIKNTLDPSWNQWLHMGCGEFAGIKVQIWDGSEDQVDIMLTDPDILQLSTGYHKSVELCFNSSSCSEYLYLDYRLTPNTDSASACSPNPCCNGGVCYPRQLSYICYCTSSYTGDRCQYRIGNLKIYARYGVNLQNKDRIGGESDPYMKVRAYEINGNSDEKTTGIDWGDEYPDWYENLTFVTGTWIKFAVSIWDKDSFCDDRLSSTYTYHLPDDCEVGIRLNAYDGGYVIFDCELA